MQKLLLLAALVVLVVYAQSGCKLKGKDKTGDFSFDLSTLGKDGGYEVNPQGDWRFMVNFCKGNKLACEDKGDDFKVQQVHKFNPWCFYLSAATTLDDSSVALVDSNDASKGVTLTYTKGESYVEAAQTITRQSVFTFTCDKTATTPQINFAGEHPDTGVNQYMFTVTSAAGCPNRGDSPGPGPGPSPGENMYPMGQYGIGGLLMTLGAVGFIGYFIIGMIVNKAKFQATGADIVPHVYFWKDFPFLLKDGVMLIVDGIQKITKRGAYAELKDPQ